MRVAIASHITFRTDIFSCPKDIKAFSMFHVDKYGIGKVVDMALDHVGRDRPIHLSFDVSSGQVTTCST